MSAMYYVIKVPGIEWSMWDSLYTAKSECDAAAKAEGVPFVIEKRETVWSSETLDECLEPVSGRNSPIVFDRR